MKKDLFEQPVFQGYAAHKLVLLQADFPPTKKKQLDPAQGQIKGSGIEIKTLKRG